MPPTSPIAAILRQLRAQKGVSQEAVAEFLGISQNKVGTWERDEQIPSALELLRSFNATYPPDVTKEDAGRFIDQVMAQRDANRAKSRERPKPGRGKKGDSIGCGGWLFLVFLLLVLVGYCNRPSGP